MRSLVVLRGRTTYPLPLNVAALEVELLRTIAAAVGQYTADTTCFLVTFRAATNNVMVECCYRNINIIQQQSTLVLVVRTKSSSSSSVLSTIRTKN
jgi:hypothetical protein